jgi:hypothetical protein
MGGPLEIQDSKFKIQDGAKDEIQDSKFKMGVREGRDSRFKIQDGGARRSRFRFSFLNFAPRSS